MGKITLTKEQARMIVDIHEIDKFMKDEEEVECLQVNNPLLLEAYKTLLKITERE